MKTLNQPSDFKKIGFHTLTATAFSLVAAGFSTLAHAGNNSELAQLKQQFKQLQGTVGALQKKVEQAEENATRAKKELATLKNPSDSQNVATTEDVQAVQSDLENFKWQWDRNNERNTVKSTRNVTLGGTVQARYGWNQERTAGTSGADNSFSISTVLLRASGNLYRDYDQGKNLDFAISFGASPQTGQANLGVLDAYLDYSVLPTLNLENPKLVLRLGQQLLPFGLEVPATEDLKPLINNAQFTTSLGLAARQIGLSVRGDLFPTVDYGSNYRAPTLEYALGIFNGNGPNQLTDDNSAKDYVGRLAFTLPVDYNSWFRELKFGASGYYGTQNIKLATGTNPFVGKGAKHRVGFDVSYNHNPVGVTFEYVKGWDDYEAGGTVAKPNLLTKEGTSYTTTVFYNEGAQFVRGFRSQAKYDDWWPVSYQPFIRWDRFDPDRKVKGDRQDILTPGINVFFAETTKLQLNYQAKFEERGHQVKNDVFQAQVQYGF
jgi:outer membrane murein-binding lipoprotein Lpp